MDWALLIAICALFFTAWQAWLLREHNRLSIKPHCVFTKVIENTSGLPLGVYLRNNGMGPAFIVEWRYAIDGIPLESKNHEGFQELVLKFELINLVECLWMDIGSAMGPQSSERILWVPDQCANEGNEKIKQLLKRANIVLEIESLYRERQTVTLQF